MPSPLEASGAPLCCSPVDPEDDKRNQVPQSERYVGQNDAEARGARPVPHGRPVDHP